MGYDPTLIAPYKSGLSKYYKPFLIGNDAFTDLVNCYSWRGNIVKREGSTVLGRIGAWKTSTGITNVSPPVVTSANHGLLTGDMVFLENVLVANATITGITPSPNDGDPTVVTTVGAHGVLAGQNIVISGSTGIRNKDTTTTFNNTVYLVTSVTPTTLTIAVETNSLFPWTGGGTVRLGNLEKTAFYITRINANTFSLQILNSSTTPPTNQPASGVAVSADIYLPIVGTRTFIQSSTGNEQLIVFTPRQAFIYNTTTNVFDDISFTTGPTAIFWEGTKDNFFYSCNYASVMWATNNISNTVDPTIAAQVQAVGIRFFNGTTAAGWFNHQPLLNTVYLNSALIVIPYKGRLIALNTTEGTNAAPPGQVNTVRYNRARWSQIGTPFVANAPSGFTNDVDAWRDDIPGKGGFIDADTSERIVSAEVIQDTLIVGFQFSTWRLRYTGNEFLPFIWERINTQFGSEATFSTIPFDDQVLQISRRGIVGASFNDVARIDMQIPDNVDEIELGSIGEGMVRVHGIRDYQKRLAYWIYGDQADNAQTPNKVLCFNYQDNTWSIFDQSFTCLGMYKLTTDNIWSTWTTPWVGDNSTWDTPLDQQNMIMTVAGSKDSRVWHMMDPNVSTDNSVNFNMSITTNLINPYFAQGKRCKLAYYDLYLTTTDKGQITLENFTDDDDSEPWLIKTVDTNNNAINLNPTQDSKYIRVYLGMIARQHQIRLTLSPSQLIDSSVGASDFEMQGVIFHTREQGRIKQ